MSSGAPEAAEGRAPHARNAALQQLWQEYHGELERFLARQLRDHVAAEDLCQEVFLRALQAWDPDVTLANPRAWLYQIARNLAIDTARRVARRPPPLSLASEPLLARPPHAPEPERIAALDDALAPLPPHLRRLLLLHYVHRYTVDEIAATHGRSPAAMRSLLFRARSQARISVGG
jgi:RNA polymerase sigma-70 factor, ECF subfamily